LKKLDNILNKGFEGCKNLTKGGAENVQKGVQMSIC